jgi:hypothetical protein
VTSEDQINATIQTYFDCMYESSADKTRAAFHPDAKITGYMGGSLQQMPVEEFAEFVAKQQPSAQSQGLPARLDVLSIEIAGDTAVARVRDDYLGITFRDTLSLIQADGQWLIYNKLFHVEGKAD